MSRISNYLGSQRCCSQKTTNMIIQGAAGPHVERYN